MQCRHINEFVYVSNVKIVLKYTRVVYECATSARSPPVSRAHVCLEKKKLLISIK